MVIDHGMFEPAIALISFAPPVIGVALIMLATRLGDRAKALTCVLSGASLFAIAPVVWAALSANPSIDGDFVVFRSATYAFACAILLTLTFTCAIVATVGQILVPSLYQRISGAPDPPASVSATNAAPWGSPTPLARDVQKMHHYLEVATRR